MSSLLQQYKVYNYIERINNHVYLLQCLCCNFRSLVTSTLNDDALIKQQGKTSEEITNNESQLTWAQIRTHLSSICYSFSDSMYDLKHPKHRKDHLMWMDKKKIHLRDHDQLCFRHYVGSNYTIALSGYCGRTKFFGCSSNLFCQCNFRLEYEFKGGKLFKAN